MSRSYKHTPIIKGDGYSKRGKKFANRKVRRMKDFDASVSKYKRLYETWNIYDWKFSPYGRSVFSLRLLASGKKFDELGWEDKKYYISK